MGRAGGFDADGADAVPHLASRRHFHSRQRQSERRAVESRRHIAQHDAAIGLGFQRRHASVAVPIQQRDDLGGEAARQG